MRHFVNKIPGYYESNAVLYMKNSETRGCVLKWKTCENYHVLSWVPALGQKEPDPKMCERCEKENKCGCDSKTLLVKGCKCGGK